VLCKSSVARRVLASAWRQGLAIQRTALHTIAADADFGAAVDACLLICEFVPGAACRDATIASGVEAAEVRSQIGWRHGTLVSDITRWERSRRLLATGGPADLRWRSGIKHDCAPVLELRDASGQLRNGLGDVVDIEPDYVYPLLKSSDVANGLTKHPRRWLVVPQRRAGEDTGRLRESAPKTWRYLSAHAARLDGRRSSVYRRQPRFAVFGIGEYSFASWKVAIAGFYKALRFSVVGGYGGRPFVLDDTCYFLPCTSRTDATRLAQVLNSDTARDFFETFIFWDAKRPVNAELLNRLNLHQLLSESASGLT
jgi:hypothetical protein